MLVPALLISALLGTGFCGAAAADPPDNVEYVREVIVDVLGSPRDTLRSNSFDPATLENRDYRESWYVPCPNPQPGDGPCPLPDSRTASASATAVQHIAVEGSILRIHGMASSRVEVFRREGDYSRASARTRLSVYLPVLEPTRMIISGTMSGTIATSEGLSDHGFVGAEWTIHDQAGDVAEEGILCGVTSTWGYTCREEPTEFHSQVEIGPGEYWLDVQAFAAIQHEIGSLFDSSAAYDLAVTFEELPTAVEEAPWSVIKKLYR